MDLINILQWSISASQTKEAEEMLKQMKRAQGFCPNLLNICLSFELDEGLRKAAVIQLKNTVIEFWKDEDEKTPSPIVPSDKEFIRSKIVDAIIKSPNSTRQLLIVVLKQLILSDFEVGWTSLPAEIMNYLNCNEQVYWSPAYLCLLTLVKYFKFKKQCQRGAFNQLMVTFLGVMKNHIEFLFNEDSELAMTIQKHIVKIFNAYTYTVISTDVINQEFFTYWMNILFAISTRPVPEQLNTVDIEERQSLIWWQCKKWAIRTLSKYAEKYSNPASAVKSDKEFSSWFTATFAAKIIQTLFSICENYSQGLYVAPKILNLVIQSFGYIIRHSQSWKYLKPHLLTLVKEVIFKVLRHTEEDEELWQEDPLEYSKQCFDVLSDPTPAFSAGILLEEMCSKRKGAIDTVMGFVTEVLNSNEADAVQKDAAFNIIIEVADVLLKNKNYSCQLEGFIINYITPVFQVSEGFRRARACKLIGKLAGAEYTNNNVITSLAQHLLNSISSDPDLPVRLMAAVALAEMLTQYDEKIKLAIVSNLQPLVLQVLTLLRETQIDEMSDVLQTIMEIFHEEIAPIAVDITSHLKDTLVTILKDSSQVEDNLSITLAGILNSVVMICTAMEKHESLIDHIEPVVLIILQTIFNNKCGEFYEECFNLVHCLTQKKISPTMWQVLFFSKSLLQDDIDEIYTMLDVLSNFVTVDKPSLVTDSSRINTILDMCQMSFSSNDINGLYETYAAKLLEMILINYRGYIDEYVPRIIELVITKMAQSGDNYELNSMCMQVIIAALYYNQDITLSILMNHNWPGKNVLIIDEFLERLVEGIKDFEGVHDRRMCMIGFTILLSLPRHQRPESLHRLSGSIMPSLVKLMDSLLKTYNNPDDYDSDEDSEDDSSDEEVLGSDEDEKDTTYNYFEEDYDEDDDGEYDEEDEEGLMNYRTELEILKTDLDTEELEATEFAHMLNAISQLNSSDPEWYQMLTGSMTEEHQKIMNTVTQGVEKFKREKEAKKNKPAAVQ